MKRILLTSLLLISCISYSSVLPAELTGNPAPEQKVDQVEKIQFVWRYTGFIFEDTHYPAPNPELMVTFEFSDEGISKLYWKRANEDYFCERLAKYFLKDSILEQETIWLNPENHFSCQNDPDMQMGKITFNHIRMPDSLTLHLYLELNGKPFIYVLERYPKSE